MRYAFLVMGLGEEAAGFDSGDVFMVGVPDIDVACTKAVDLMNRGFNVIELCGAFGEDGAGRIVEATGGKVAVGYVVQYPGMERLFEEAFD